MDITFGATLLASKATNPVYAVALNGQQINDEAQFFRAATITPIARGNRSTEISFSVTRTFNTVVDCEVFILTHLNALSQQADLLCQCTGVGDAAEQDCTLSGSVLTSIRFSENRGLTVVVQYTFKGGLFVNEDVPPPPDGEDTLKAGTSDLSTSDESVTIVFAIAFGAAPSGITATLLVPGAGEGFSVWIDQSTVSAIGFTARFAAPVPDIGYKLSWIAVA